MSWPRVLVIILDLYLLGSLGAWFVLRFLLWRLHRQDSCSANDESHLQELEKDLEHHVSLWPTQPRPGRYREIDDTAQDTLKTLEQVVDQIRERWPVPMLPASTFITFSEALRFRAWPPLCKAFVAWRQCRQMQQLLDRAENLLATLKKKERQAHQIPEKVHAALHEMRAETRRIGVLLEAEVEAGTTGLEDAEHQLQTIYDEIERGLDILANTEKGNMAVAVLKADELMGRMMPQLEELDDFMERTARARSRTENVAQRVQSSLELAQERWEGLKARGATESSVQRELETLQKITQEIKQTARQRTVKAYRRVTKEVSHFDVAFQSLSNKLDQLDDLMEQSRETIRGDVQALTQAQAECDDLCKKNPLLEPDRSVALIEEAADAYMEAERQRSLGTLEGYQSAITLSKRAESRLQEATESLSDFLEKRNRIRHLLDQLSSEALGEWHERVHRLREALHVYTVHWEKGLAEKVGQAASNLEQVSMDLERVPSDIRHERSFRQTELPDALRILSHAQTCFERAKESIGDLEQEKERIESLREELDSQMETLTQETWPDLESKKEQMLPEVRERMEALRQEFVAQRHRIEIPSQVDYHRAYEEWLPSLTSQLKELLSTHKNDRDHYQKAAQETEKALQRMWTRLNKMRPYEQPMPQEDIDTLNAELESWQAAIKENAENPATLRTVVGRRATALQERMENAQRQIREGRKGLKDLSRAYQRSTRRIHALRSNIDEMQENSQWPHIMWETSDAEEMWEQAIALERQSTTASTLREANNRLQEAVNAAQNAEEMYRRTVNQMERALRQLSDELQAAERRLGRGRDRVQSLQQEGSPKAAEETSEVCDRAERRVEMATSASTFEDALRHLREARNILAPL
ncbi:MAG: hypothetical protein ACLFV5_01950 [Anaerolineales bacterium]